MTSLLERMNISPTSGGPVRARSVARASSAPYNRADRPKGDVNSTWSHDLFEDNNALSLSDRLTGTPVAAPPRPNITPTIAQRALRDATGNDSQLSIKGASTSSQGNVVEVTGLVRGTTPDDVCTIFKRCGAISNAKNVPSAPAYQDCVTIRVTFKTPASALAAVQKFHNQPADGKTLNVKIVGSASAGTSLGGRLGGADGLGIVRQEGSVDVLMDGGVEESGSKMRSDSLIADPRAHVLLAPPGADPADYTSSPAGQRGQGLGGRRGRGNGRRGRRGTGKMDTD